MDSQSRKQPSVAIVSDNRNRKIGRHHEKNNSITDYIHSWACLCHCWWMPWWRLQQCSHLCHSDVHQPRMDTTVYLCKHQIVAQTVPVLTIKLFIKSSLLAKRTVIQLLRTVAVVTIQHVFNLAVTSLWNCWWQPEKGG